MRSSVEFLPDITKRLVLKEATESGPATMAENGQPILLQPFKHQVGGHFLIMEINQDWICKPMESKERLFYETVPEPLKQFIPMYKGVLNVCFRRGKNGEFQYIGYPMSDETSTVTHTMNDVSSMHSVTEEENIRFLKCSRRGESRDGVKSMPFTTSNSTPWTDVCKKLMTNVLEEENDESKLHEYIVIENLTGKFKCPCVLDLKVGTRTHSDGMSEAKKQLHLKRCETTTSKTIGVRLGGMQLYNTLDSKYYFMDKYYGRSFTPQTFCKSITDFLYSGKRYRWELFPDFIRKLKDLREVLKTQDSYRLFSSSLLIMYEGDDQEEESEGTNVSPTVNGHVPTPPSSGAHDCSSPAMVPSSQSDTRKLLDVRMIDFCNTTHRHCIDDPVKYDGPDEGYLLGLTTIIDALETFLKNKN